jgi:Fis family transcriptional regulator, factor for inversion stimulation protein
MAEKYSDNRFIEANPMPSFLAMTERDAVSLNSSLSRVVRGMYNLETPYQDATREFQRRYIVRVLIKQACHFGRAAEELGIHRNTLTRTIRDLKIDPKQVRKAVPVSAVARNPSLAMSFDAS